MDTGWIITLSTAASVAITGLLVKAFLPSYLNEKAKNLATKEDIGAITNEVELVKRQHASQLEMLRTNLDQRKHVSNAQFEREFEAYQEIWKAVVEVDSAFERVVMVWTAPIEQQATEKHARLEKLQNAHNHLVEIAEQRRPFYATEVWLVIKSLLETFRCLAFDVMIPDTSESHAEYSKKQKELFDEIRQHTEAVCEAIRLRLTSLRVG